MANRASARTLPSGRKNLFKGIVRKDGKTYVLFRETNLVNSIDVVDDLLASRASEGKRREAILDWVVAEIATNRFKFQDDEGRWREIMTVTKLNRLPMTLAESGEARLDRIRAVKAEETLLDVDLEGDRYTDT